MKKILLVSLMLTSLLSPVVLFPAQSDAVNVFGKTCRDEPNSSVCKNTADGDRQNPFIAIIKAAITILSIFAGVAAVIGIIVSGLRMITAGGNSEAVASARSGLTYSLVGIAIVIIAQSIVVFVINRL